MDADTVTKLIGLLVPLFDSVRALGSSLAERIGWVRSQDVGRWLGPAWYSKGLVWLQYFAVSFVVLASFGALVGGLLHAFGPPGSVWPPLDILFERSWQLVILYLALAISANWWVTVGLWPVPFLFPVDQHSPAIFNLRRLRHEGPAKGQRLNVDLDRCRSVANRVNQVLRPNWDNRWITAAVTDPDVSSSRAVRPEGLTESESANLLLVACGFEGELTRLGRNRSYPFRDLYATLGNVARSSGLFREEAIVEYARTSNPYYAALRAAAFSEHPDSHVSNVDTLLPDERAFAATVDQLVRTLGRDFRGSARSLSRGWLGRTSSRILLRRLSSLPGFGSDGMRQQFRKLAMIWGIWPEVRPARFSYPRARRLALLLLNTGCVVGSAAVKSIPNSAAFSDLVAWAENKVVEQVEALLEDALLSSGPANRHVRRWLLAAEVDYFLWSQARADDLGALGAESTATWKIQGNEYVVAARQ